MRKQNSRLPASDSPHQTKVALASAHSGAPSKEVGFARRPAARRNSRRAPPWPRATGATSIVEAILVALTALKKGKLLGSPSDSGLAPAGKVADAFNEVAKLLEKNTEDLSRISRVVGKEGRISERLSAGNATGGWAERNDSVNHPHPLSSYIPSAKRARDRRRGQRGSLPNHGFEVEEGRLEGEFFAHRENSQHDGRSTRRVRFRSDPRRARVGTEGKLGGSQGERRCRHLEGPDPQCESDGEQSHQPGPQHRHRPPPPSPPAT